MAAPTAARVWPSRCDRAHAAQIGCVHARALPWEVSAHWSLEGPTRRPLGGPQPTISVSAVRDVPLRRCGGCAVSVDGSGKRCDRPRSPRLPLTRPPSPPRSNPQGTPAVDTRRFGAYIQRMAIGRAPPRRRVSRRGGWPAPAPHPSPVGHGGSDPLSARVALDLPALVCSDAQTRRCPRPGRQREALSATGGPPPRTLGRRPPRWGRATATQGGEEWFVAPRV